MGKNWKDMERRVAKILDGERIPVADKRSLTDVLCDKMVIECKYRTKDVGTGLIYSWLEKVRKIGVKEGKIGALVFKKKGTGYRDIIIMDLKEFKKISLNTLRSHGNSERK